MPRALRSALAALKVPDDTALAIHVMPMAAKSFRTWVASGPGLSARRLQRTTFRPVRRIPRPNRRQLCNRWTGARGMLPMR
jgi:hypothetical protein